MTIVCSCEVIVCSRGNGCPVQEFFMQMQELHGPLNPHISTHAELLKAGFYTLTGREDTSRCGNCWALVLEELKLIYDTGACLPDHADHHSAMA